MDIKIIIKRILSPIRKVRYGIVDSDGFLYIGGHCKIVGAKIIRFGKNVSIMPYTMLVTQSNDSKIIIGDRTEIGMYSRIAAQNYVEFEENVLTGPHIFIADYNHEYSDVNKPIMYQGNSIKPSEHFPLGG